MKALPGRFLQSIKATFLSVDAGEADGSLLCLSKRPPGGEEAMLFHFIPTNS